MKKRILLTVLSLLFVCASIVSADKNHNNQHKKKPNNNAIVAYNNLSLTIDLWHDASLKADNKAVAEHKQMMFDIISDDIKENYQSVSYAKLDASYTKEETKNSANKNLVDDLNNDENSLKTKKLLLASLKNSKSFAYSYRLLADYLQLLKNDIDANKIEIADVAKNAGQVRDTK